MISLRKATINDLTVLQKLNNELGEFETENNYDTYVKDWAFGNVSKDYFLQLIKEQFVILAEFNNVVIGYLAGSISTDDTYSFYDGITAELDNMFINSNYRKMGIGKKMINAFVDWANKNEAKRIFVSAKFHNNNAITFYENLGFERTEITLKKELK